MRMIGFNYVKFLMKYAALHREEDGEFISAAIYSSEEELLVHDAGSDSSRQRAGRKAETVKGGECMLVLGIRESTSPCGMAIRHGGMLYGGRCHTKLCRRRL